jgi:hypothetical protein
MVSSWCAGAPPLPTTFSAEQAIVKAQSLLKRLEFRLWAC